RDAAGRPVGAYQFVHDVTERIAEHEQLARAEAARREADALYRAYFENTAEALFIVGVRPDGDFSLEEINPAHEAATGLQLAAIRGRPLDEQLPADVAREVAVNYRRAVAEGRPIAYRERLAMPAGPRHWDTVLVPVRNAEGQIWRLIGSARDVTAQVLAEEQLLQSQKLEAMGSLVGGVAHDVNNLLSPIVGGLDLLQRRGVGDDRTRRLVDGAMQSAERARVLVQRLLAFARRQPLQAVAVDVGELVEGMADLVASTSGPRVRVELDIAPDLPLVSADANQLEMAVLNLSVNARDAMPDGGTLTLAVAPETLPIGHRAKLPPGDYVRLAVSDTGIGMDAETARRAIEPFFSTKGVGRGTGLGLSMAHGLAAQLSGALVIGSRPGLGTTIELWLPVAGHDAVRAEPRPSISPPAAAGTALLVDDEDLVRASTADMLADIGYHVVEATSAEAALRLFDDGLRPDLLVTDHLMPGMSGTDLARELSERQPGLRVLVVSGYADVEGIAPDLARLEKPFRRADLATAVAALVPA
ncbi:MAG: PAS domain-containing protein, partial [Sphingomonadaceae bacterium]|nr:PAS domain-containing protein [Sphingomonadaceae bacterium]